MNRSWKRSVIGVLVIALGGTIIAGLLIPYWTGALQSHAGGPEYAIAGWLRRMCEFYRSTYGDLPYDVRGGDAALRGAAHALYDHDSQQLDTNLRCLRGHNIRAPSGFVGYVYLNDPDADKLPLDTILLVEKPWAGMGRRIVAADMVGGVYVALDRRADPYDIIGKRARTLIEQNELRALIVEKGDWQIVEQGGSRDKSPPPGSGEHRND